MPARRSPDPSVKNPELDERLRDDGAPKDKAARNANAAARRGEASVTAKGGRSGSSEDWTVPRLRCRAAELGISGRSSMRTDELISAPREH